MYFTKMGDLLTLPLTCLPSAVCHCGVHRLQEVLYKELQQLPQLAQLPENVAGEHFSLPHPNSTRAQRAKQAHALAVAGGGKDGCWLHCGRE